MEEMLCSGELDLFIGVMYQDNPKLDSTPLLNDHIYMVCSDHLLKKYYPDTWSVLKNRSEQGTDLSGFSGLPFLLPHPSIEAEKDHRPVLPVLQDQAQDLPGIPVHGAIHFPVSL